jgi:adenosine kinase
VPVAKERSKADPTGVGDAFRAGFLTARDWGLSWERSAQVGSLLATMVLETVGTQEYLVAKDEFSARLAESYGDDCAAEILPHLV